jgi:hypothetical protein
MINRGCSIYITIGKTDNKKPSNLYRPSNRYRTYVPAVMFINIKKQCCSNAGDHLLPARYTAYECILLQYMCYKCDMNLNMTK